MGEPVDTSAEAAPASACQNCDGKGELHGSYPCRACNGTGKAPVNEAGGVQRYGEREIRALGQRYADHMLAMTAEGLISKGDIAAELAWRDWVIECEQDARTRLDAALSAAQQRISDLEAQCAELKDINARLAGDMQEPIDYTLQEAIRIAGLWSAGKMIGGDPHGVINALLTAMQDALRYRWLRDESTSYEDHPFIALRSHGAVSRWSGPHADAAIDAAMAAKADDWLTREARQIGLHSPACASVRFGQNECDCGAAMAAKEAG